MGVAQAENSEVLLFGSVAVAVIIGPGPESFGNEKLKLAVHDASVVVLTNPRKRWPSPFPDRSQAAFAKNSIRNCVFAVLFKVPRIVVVVESAVAEVITGKFCGLIFGPTALSQLSFAVTPGGLRSIPRSELEKIELPRTAFPVPLAITTPPPLSNPASPPNPLLVIVLPARSTVPPILLLLAPEEITTPLD